jgi:MSHA biogenesis protein MshQ
MAGVGTVAWTAPGNTLNSDNVYATAVVVKNTTTNYLNCTGFNFSTVPSAATVTSITVSMEVKTSGGTITDAFVYLVKGGVIQTAVNGATTTTYGTVTPELLYTHGTASPLWGTTWTGADVQATNFGVAFAAKNTSKTSKTNRTISLDHIKVTVAYAATPVDHFKVTASAIGSTCAVSNVTIAAHTSTDTAPTASVGQINLSTSDGKGDWSVVTGTGQLTNIGTNLGTATYLYGTGETSATLGLSHTATGAVIIGVANSSGTSMLAKTPAAELSNSITFSGGGFSITDSAGIALTTAALTQTAGTTSTTFYLKATDAACSPSFKNAVASVDMAFECIDPTTCQSPVVSIISPPTNVTTLLGAGLPNGSLPATTPASAYKTVSLNFNANSLAPFQMIYPDVGQITLYFKYAASSLLSESTPFVVKPADFTVTGVKRTSDGFANPASSTVTGTAFVKAGEAFTATVTAVNALGNPTLNFGKENKPESVKLTPTLVAPTGGATPTITCSNVSDAATCSSSVPIFTFLNGEATNSKLAWTEVGAITLVPSILDTDYMGEGDVLGSASSTIGRFYPDHFDVTVLAGGATCTTAGLGACPTTGFVYADEPFNVTVDAKDVADAPLFNYTGSFAKTISLSAVNVSSAAISSTVGCILSGNASGTNDCSAAGPSMLTLSNGSATLAETEPAAMRFHFVTQPTVPTDMYVKASDGDATSATASPASGHPVQEGFKVVSGRVKLANAVGSELLPLTAAATIQYFNAASNWVTNVDDLATAILATDFAMVFPSMTNNNLSSACQTTLTLTGSSPNYILNLSAPGSRGSGAVDMVLNLGASATGSGCISGAYTASTTAGAPWLQYPSDSNPSARMSFGVYKGRKEFIYMRESY